MACLSSINIYCTCIQWFQHWYDRGFDMDIAECFQSHSYPREEPLCLEQKLCEGYQGMSRHNAPTQGICECLPPCWRTYSTHSTADVGNMTHLRWIPAPFYLLPHLVYDLTPHHLYHSLAHRRSCPCYGKEHLPWKTAGLQPHCHYNAPQLWACAGAKWERISISVANPNLKR